MFTKGHKRDNVSVRTLHGGSERLTAPFALTDGLTDGLDVLTERRDEAFPQRRPALRVAFRVATTVAAGLAGAACFVLAYTWVLGSPFSPSAGHPFAPYNHLVLVAALARGAIFAAGKHDRNRRPRGVLEEFLEGCREALAGSCVLVLVVFFWRGGTKYRTFSYSRSIILADLALAAVGVTLVIVVTKLALQVLRARGHDSRRVAVIGTATSSEAFINAVANHPETGYRVSRWLDTNGREGAQLLEELHTVAASTAVDEVVITTPVFERDDLARLVGLSRLRKVAVRAVPDFLGLPPSKVELEPVLEFPLLSLLRDPRSRARRRISRFLDLAVGLVAVTATAPVMAVAAIAVKLTSPGPILFRQDRLGMDGRPFRLLKFRTMQHGADTKLHLDYVSALITGSEVRQGEEQLFKLVADPRVTKVGRVLRRYSIDELPQLFNVLRGDMSLVGPRPPLAAEVALYESWHRRRLDVRPGLTGLWQVSGRSRMSFDDMVRLDLQYIENWSPLEDCRILLRTIPAVLRREAS
ncbi:MAG: hypothetical protein QOI20_2484 [Acidimicrobiaceae bacterium]|jgi:exopolysaccharide biosynthesis polyprenyl glycosylphosphotransferase|nr:hypothetical protein [Acidimicrobiaceae bacterium]